MILEIKTEIENLGETPLTEDEVKYEGKLSKDKYIKALEEQLADLKTKKESDKDFDKAAEDLRLATRHLGMLVGKVDVEEILGSIFNDFCIGK